MITQEKLAIYEHFVGDIDGFARIATVAQKQTINSDDWNLIDACIQDVKLVSKGLAAHSFLEIVRDKCDNELTYQTLKKLAETSKI